VQVEADYGGPHLSQTDDGRYSITEKFINEMIEWYKGGKSIARWYVWEIVLGCVDAISQEPSLVGVDIEEGTNCDVIGDVHSE